MENKLKSIFIMIFINAAALIAMHTVYLFFINGFQSLLLGRLIVAATIAFLFIKAMALHNTPRTSKNMWLRTLIISMGLLLSLYGNYTSIQDILSSLPSVLLTIGWLVYVFWYSRFGKRDTTQLRVNTQLPEFEIEDIDKNKVLASSFLGKPSIFMFYRGNWCPLCMAQIKELVNQYKELEKRGVQMVLISPQPHKFTRDLAKKFDVNFNFMVDADNKAAIKLGIFHKNGLPAGMQMLGYDSDSVMPTVVITDKDGKILFADLTDNYRVRPEPETFLKVLDGTYNMA